MQKINFQNLPNTTTPINATNLNAIQTNVENVFNGNEVAGNMIVESISSKNMFDKNAVLNNYELIGSGSYAGGINPQTGWYVSDYIEVEANKKYYLTKSSSGSSICFYNTNKAYVSVISSSNGVITIPNNSSIKYMRFNGVMTDLDNVQFEKGETQTTYTPYQNLESKIIDSGWITLNSYIKYRKVNNIVYVVCDNNGFVNIPADSSYHAIGTLPTNYRPSIVIPFASHVYSVATKSIIGRVETNGNISIYANVSIDYFGFSIAFPV